MLRLKQLRAKACRGIVDGPPLDFDADGLILCGDNGTGKSSFVDALEKVLTGVCGSLDTGDQGLSWAKQGRHIQSTGIPEIELILTDDKNDISINLLTSLSSQSGHIAAYLSVAAKQCFMLRRRSMLEFITTKGAERYKVLQEYLDVGKFIIFEEQLRVLTTGIERQMQAALSEKSETEADLRLRIQLDNALPIHEAECLKKANTYLVGLNLEPVIDLADAANRIGEIESALATFAGVEKLGAVNAFYEKVNDIPLEKDLVDAGREYLKVFLICRDEEQKVKGHFYASVLKAGLKWIEEDKLESCPLCNSTINNDEVTLLIRNNLQNNEHLQLCGQKRLEAYQRYLTKFQSYESAFKYVERSWMSGMNEGCPQNISAVCNRLSACKIHDEMGYEDIDRTVRTVSELDLDRVRASIMALIKIKSSTFPDVTKYDALQRAKRVLVHICESIPTIKSLEQTISGYEPKLTGFNTVRKHAERARKRAVQDVLNNVANTADEYYQELHPGESIGSVVMKMADAKTGSVGLQGQFYDVTADPRGHYSEAHIDSLGLCLFLALRRHQYIQFPQFALLVLDDILHSVDGEHRRRTAELIFSKFSDHQIVITTHDRLWFEYLKHHSSSRKVKHLRIAQWSIETGPVWGDHLADYEWLLSAEGKNSTSSDRIVKAGRLLEHMLQNISDSLKIAVQFSMRGDYTINTLWEPFYKKAKKKVTFNQYAGIFLENIEKTRQLRNWVGAHWNEWAQNLSTSEADEFITAVIGLREAIYCRNCGRFLQAELVHEIWWCKCENLKYGRT